MVQHSFFVGEAEEALPEKGKGSMTKKCCHDEFFMDFLGGRVDENKERQDIGLT